MLIFFALYILYAMFICSDVYWKICVLEIALGSLGKIQVKRQVANIDDRSKRFKDIL